MKIVHVETLLSCGNYAASAHWARTRRSIHRAVKRCAWPPGSDRFTIYPQSGKKRGEGNGVVPIRSEFIKELRKLKWTIEAAAKNDIGESLGHLDAVLLGPRGAVVVEWETASISSSHYWMNKLAMLVSNRVIAAGTLVVPSRKLYTYLTDRIGNFQELEPYLKLWKSVPCEAGVLEIVVIEQDAESYDVPKIPRGTSERTKGRRSCIASSASYQTSLRAERLWPARCRLAARVSIPPAFTPIDKYFQSPQAQSPKRLTVLPPCFPRRFPPTSVSQS